MKKWLTCTLLVMATLHAQTSAADINYLPVDANHPGPVYRSGTTGGSGKGAARATRAGNRCGITLAQMGAGLVVAGMVTVFAAFVTNNNGHAH